MANEYKINSGFPVIDISVSSSELKIIISDYNIYGGLLRTNNDTNETTIISMLPANIVLDTSTNVNWLNTTVGTVYDETAAVLNVSINKNTTTTGRLGRIWLKYDNTLSDNYILIKLLAGTTTSKYTYRVLWTLNNDDFQWSDNTTTDVETFETGTTKELKLTKGPLKNNLNISVISKTGKYQFTGWTSSKLSNTPEFTVTDITSGNVSINTNCTFYACGKQQLFTSGPIYYDFLRSFAKSFNVTISDYYSSNVLKYDASIWGTGAFYLNLYSTASGTRTINYKISATVRENTSIYYTGYLMGWTGTAASDTVSKGSGTSTDPYLLYLLYDNGSGAGISGNPSTKFKHELTVTFS